MCSVSPLTKPRAGSVSANSSQMCGAADDAHVAFQRLIHPRLDDRQGVVHEIAPTWSLELARPFGWRPLAERRRRRARADAVAAEHHEVGLLPLPRRRSSGRYRRRRSRARPSSRFARPGRSGSRRAPAAIAFGHSVRETSCSAPVGQPLWQALQLLQAGLPSKGSLRMPAAWPSGASPSRSSALPARTPRATMRRRRRGERSARRDRGIAVVSRRPRSERPRRGIRARIPRRLSASRARGRTRCPFGSRSAGTAAGPRCGRGRAADAVPHQRVFGSCVDRIVARQLPCVHRRRPARRPLPIPESGLACGFSLGVNHGPWSRQTTCSPASASVFAIRPPAARRRR